MPKPQFSYGYFAKNRPLAVVLLGTTGTQAIGAIREFMELRRTNGGRFAYEPPVDENQWLSFYSYRTLEKATAELLLEDNAPLVLGAIEALRKPEQSSDENRIAALGIILTVFMPANWPIAKSLLEAVLGSPECEEADLAVFDTPPMQFLVRVLLPCLFAHGCLPGELLAQTFEGNVKVAEQAVEHLVKLDPRISGHRFIERWVNLDPRTAAFRARRLAKWKQGPAPFDKTKADSHYTKIVFSMLSQVSILLDSRLETCDLKKLVELQGEGVPDDVANYVKGTKNETIRREIGKKQGFFQLPARPDRSSYESVRFLLALLSRVFGHDARSVTD